MNIPSHPTLIRQMLDARVKKFRATGPVVTASLVTIAKTCGRLGCRCERGEKHLGHYLTFKEDGKTRTVYVPQELVTEVESWVEEHRRLRKLSQEITQLSVALVRSHVTARKRKAGRP